MYPNRNLGFYPGRDTVLNRNSYDPDPSQNHLSQIPDYYNSNVYASIPQYQAQPQYIYDPNQFLANAPTFYPGSFEYPQRDFPSLVQPKPPIYQAKEYFPPGLSQPLPPNAYSITPNLGNYEEKPRTSLKAPNPNAQSFIPSNLFPSPSPSPPPPPSPPPIPNKDEEELLIYGVRGITAMQKTFDNDLALLTRGRDLTKLGLNLKGNENLASTLLSVMQEGDLEASEQVEFVLPACYLINKPTLKMKTLGLLSCNSLFYMFYNMPGEIMQALAAEELYKRDWVYAPSRQVWYLITPVECKMFDTMNWEVVATNRPNVAFLTKDEVKVKRPVS